MAHEIQDKDLHFLIDPITRAITNQTAAKVKLMQFDHNSERFTFEVPRFVEGHDMTLCTKVEVHYINIAGNKQDQHADVYRVEDMATEGEGDTEKVTFSWLVSAGATQYAGSLSFVVRFTCLTGEKLDYAWSTSIFSGISIGEGMNNGDSVLEDYTDVLAVWEAQISTHIEAVEALREEVEVLKEITPEVVHETGDSTEAVMSQAAVTAALDDLKENGASIELAPTLEGNDTDKAPSVKAVNDGLAGKVAHSTYGNVALYGLSASGTDIIYNISQNNPIANRIAQYTTDRTIRTQTPQNDLDAANKRYVDDLIAPLLAEVGGQIKMISVFGDKYGGWYVPTGAFPYFYLATTQFEYDVNIETGESAFADFTELRFYDAGGALLGTERAKPYTFYEMPSGTVQIHHDGVDLNDYGNLEPPQDIMGNMYMPPLSFQVKVGASNE